MATMYETIMNLPLFKGVSSEQVSAFLEKTHLEFKNYSANETIVSKNDPVNSIKCIISGNASIRYHFDPRYDFTLIETVSGEFIIGADRLFGMETTYNADITALDHVSIMEFQKEQYLNLINSAPIYLLNYLNFLSFRAQKNTTISTIFPLYGLKSILKYLIEIFTSRRAKQLTFEFDLISLSKFTNISEQQILLEIEEMIRCGAIERTTAGIRIIDKELL